MDGVYQDDDGGRYEGFWKDDQRDGQGTEVQPNKSCYSGYYKEGIKHGFVKYEWADGSSYTGYWCKNLI